MEETVATMAAVLAALVGLPVALLALVEVGARVVEWVKEAGTSRRNRRLARSRVDLR